MARATPRDPQDILWVVYVHQTQVVATYQALRYRLSYLACCQEDVLSACGKGVPISSPQNGGGRRMEDILGSVCV